MADVVRLEGIDGLAKALNDKAKLADVKEVVSRNGAALQERTQTYMSNAYRGHWTWKKGKGRVFKRPTGATRRSVTVRLADNGLTAVVAPHTKYFPYLEKGTRFMESRPTLKPALQYQSFEFINDLRKLTD